MNPPVKYEITPQHVARLRTSKYLQRPKLWRAAAKYLATHPCWVTGICAAIYEVSDTDAYDECSCFFRSWTRKSGYIYPPLPTFLQLRIELCERIATLLEQPE